MQNIAIIRQGTWRYLFSVPENVTLKEGDIVKCSTKRGITDGVAFADSAWVDENVSRLIGKLTGAKFPLKSVAGKMEYQPFEKPQDKSANKYDGMSNRELDREICTRGMCSARNGWERKHDCLFVGTSSCDVTDANRADVIKYLLAEDAEPEPEAEPKYFSGKVVCVSSGDNCFSVGKMYEFVNGEIKDDDGDERPVCADEQFKSVEEWNSEYGMPIARFIEFKGEAHD